MKVFSTFALLALSTLSAISPSNAAPTGGITKARATQPLPLQVDIIHEFAPKTWVENLAIRHNGKILVTLLSSPDIYEINPNSKKDKAPVLVHTFPDHLGLTGITETTRDTFYVVAGNYSIATGNNPAGAWDVYEVDVCNGPKNAKVKKIANFPQSRLLNGAVTLNARQGLILVADAIAGLVYRLNVKTGQVSVAIDDPTMKAPAGGSPIAVNGLKIRDGVLYFTNSAAHTFVKIPISADGSAAGPATILSTNARGDDFTLDDVNNAFLAQNNINNLGFLPARGGDVTVLTGAPLTSNQTLAGPSACQFGRKRKDREVLYITTTAGDASGAGTPTLGGTLSKVNLAGTGYYDKGS